MSIARPALAAIAALGTSLALACLAAPWILTLAGIDPTETDLLNRLAGPSAAHPLGTDDLGRDLLARLLDGGRVSIVVGLTAAVIAATIGSVLGVVAGYFGGRFDALLMRFTDGVIALPLLAGVSVMLPLPSTMPSLNVSTRLLSTSTSACPLDGDSVTTDGATLSATPNVYCTPRKLFLTVAASVMTPAATDTT